MYKRKGRDGSDNNNNGGSPVTHTCIICEMVYTSANALLAHMRSAHEALMDFSDSVIEIYVSMMNETAHQDSKQVADNKKANSYPLATKRRRSALPVRRPNDPLMNSFKINYPCCLCNEIFKSPDHRERHAWGCVGGIRVPRRPRSVPLRAQQLNVAIQDQQQVPLSSFARAVRRKTDMNQSLTPLDRKESRPSGTEHIKIDLNHPAPPDDSVCRKFDLNWPWRQEDDDEDNAPINAPIARLHRSYT